MKPDQQAALDLPSEPAGTAFECEWKPAGPNNVVDLDVMVDGNYLRAGVGVIITLAENLPEPAVVVASSSDRFNCNLIVGTSPKDSFQIVVIAEDRNADACPQAVAIAQRVVGNLAG